jgi:hypothetical protein
MGARADERCDPGAWSLCVGDSCVNNCSSLHAPGHESRSSWGSLGAWILLPRTASIDRRSRPMLFRADVRARPSHLRPSNEHEAAARSSGARLVALLRLAQVPLGLF